MSASVPARADPLALSRRAAEAAAGLPALLVEAERVATSVLGGVHGRRRSGQGDSFWEYRPIRPGESAARVDWRRTARSGRAFVRETEWEAAQTVCLARDAGARMAWRSDPKLPTKGARAELLLLGLASLLLRGGEHPRLCERGDLLSPPAFGARAIERLALRLATHAADAAPRALGLPAHARMVLFDDFLSPIEATRALLSDLHARPVGGVLVQVLDPAETSLPFRGRVRFRGVDGGGEMLASRAEGLRDAYLARLASHQAELRRLATDAGFALLVHRTDHAPREALAALYGVMTAR